MITTSRRKQTKPIRVYEDYESMLPTPGPGEPYPYSNGGGVSRDDGGQQDDDMPMDLHISIISCSKCPETFPTQEDLARHVAAAHTKLPAVEKQPREEDKGYPTAYHRLGREFQQENKFLNGHEDQTVPVSNMLADPMQADCKELLGVPVNKGDGNRIFHQDAFCELCEREFCNKYFLKTHKANKHGIYENSTSPFSMNSVSGSSPVSMVLPPEPPMQLPISLKMEQPLSKPILAFPKTEPKLSTTVKLEATKPEVPVQKPAPEIKKEPFVSKPPITNAISTAVVSSSSIISSSSSSNNNNNNNTAVPRLDMEDYCEICQKHFCNKYYLKKHKQDVHGIVPENPTTPQSGKRRHIPSSIASLDCQTTMTASTSSQMILPPPVVNMGLPNMPLNMPGVMVLNPFMPPVAIIPAQSLLPQPPGHSQPSAIISQPLPLCSVSELAPSSTAASIITSSTSASSPHDSSGNSEQSKMLPSVCNDSLRGIGVLNAEAYCELCRKEFCNKYFLKVHRANKHGIFCDDLSLPFGMSSEALDASMLAGIKIPFDMKMEPGTQSSPNAASNSESPVTYCNLCSTEFSSKYSYKIHRMNVHGMLNENLFDGCDMPMSATDLSSSEGLLKVAAEVQMLKASSGVTSSAGDTSATTIFGNMIAAKLADRVICDICNKELTNKYFLKAHKLRVHGIDLSPQEKAAEAAAAAAYSSGKQTPISSSGMKTPVSNPKDQRDLSIITAEMITQDILQRSQTLNLSKKQHDLSHLTPESSSEKPSSDELVKLGIDPEAYCEICKKEFCSKYFLRTHKLNIHGIRSDKLDCEPATKVSTPYSSAPKNILPKSSSMGNVSAPSTMNNLTSNFHNNLLNSSLFSMAGFNPFGHQGGIPGFPGLSGFPGMPSLPGLNLTSSLFGNTSISSIYSSSSSNNKLKEQLKESRSSKEMSGKNCNKEGPPTSSVIINSVTSPVTSAANSLNSNGNSVSSKGKEGFERHTWRWKEPANSSRVSCEICNKELCNKYFLRTHKLNKHGIVPSVGSNSPAPSDTETASNASSSEKPDLGMPDKNGQTPSHTPKQDHSPLPSPSGDKSEKPSGLFKPTQLFKFKTDDDILNNRGYNSFAEICHICDRRFKNEHWLKAHIVKDHGGWPMMDMYKLGSSTPPVEGSVLGIPDPKTCQVCGLQFPSELSMQLHLIQEHNAQVTLKEDGDASTSGDECLISDFGYGLGFKKRVLRTEKLKMYVCHLCNFKTRWISNLYNHEETEHNVCKNTKLCPKSFPGKLVVNRHAEHTHGDKPLHISSSGSRKEKPTHRFRCVICGEKFLSRAICSKHLRQVHIRSLKDFSPPVKSKHSCSLCKFSTFYPRLLQQHMDRSHDKSLTQAKFENDERNQRDEMDDEERLIPRKEIIINNVYNAPVIQSFNLDVKTSDSIFLPAVAKMPVREKVDKVMAVTFVLTPVNP